MSVKTIYKPLKFLYWYIMYTFITFIVKEMQENKIMYISEVKSGNTSHVYLRLSAYVPIIEWIKILDCELAA